MATLFWLGTADSVKQVATVQITADDVTTTYTITIGGHTVSILGSGTGVNDTATALQVALDAVVTDVYFEAIDFTVATDTVTFTAAVDGVPFVATSSVNGGAGTIGAVTSVTVSSGPNDWSTAANWDTGSIPVNTDDVIIENSSVNIAWGLAQSGVTLDSLTVKKTFTGKIGLKRTTFATSADADTATASADGTGEIEYRDRYLAISSTIVTLGENFGPAQPAGSGRIMLDLGSNAATVEVHSTKTAAAETGLSAIRILANNSSTDIFVRGATGGVGVAVDEPGETSTIRKMSISDTTSTGSRVTLSDGVTITDFEALGGISILESAATVTNVTSENGTLQTEGDFTITNLNVRGGTVKCNHIKTSASAVTTATIDSGTLDGQDSAQSRTWDTVQLNVGGVLKGNDNITITNLLEDTNNYTLTAS